MSTYLQRQALYPKIIEKTINNDLAIIVVIPAFDEPDIISTLKSLLACDKPQCAIEVIVAINYGEHIAEELKIKSNIQSEKVRDWMLANETAQFKMYTILLDDLPKKHAGVGLARKIAMDEAVRRFEAIDTNGTLVCLDADCTVSKNYLKQIEEHFKINIKCIAANVDFEHILKDEKEDNAIILYELFLRYYIEGLRYADYHFAFHTIGSTIIVKSKTYQKQGGMNKRKAGEDFYFLHKIFPLGDFGEISKATVYPSARTSHRVPFGTGKAILEWNEGKKDLNLAYDFEVFQLLKQLFNSINKSFEISSIEDLNLNSMITDYLHTIEYEKALQEIRQNTSDKKSFTNRLKRYWDGFKVLKLVHYLRDEHLPQKNLVNMAAVLLAEKYNLKIIAEDKSAMALLKRYRQQQKKRN